MSPRLCNDSIVAQLITSTSLACQTSQAKRRLNRSTATLRSSRSRLARASSWPKYLHPHPTEPVAGSL